MVVRLLSILAKLATYDFSPRWSRKVRAWVASPVGILLVSVLVAVLVGLVIHPRVFALAGGLALVLALGFCWPWLTVRSLRAELQFDIPRCSEGESAAGLLTITNPLPWPAWGLTLSEAGEEAWVRIPPVPGRTKTQCRWRLPMLKRGVYPRQSPEVKTGFPFGTWEPRRRAQVQSTLLVWPRTYPVGPVPTSAVAEAPEGNVNRNRVGSTGDILGVRPYRRGDSPRRIHWSQSAKHDRLIVCELQAQSRPVVLLLLDADPAVHSPGEQGSREWAFRVAASLARGWLESGTQVGLALAGQLIPPQAGREQIVRILDALAQAPPESPGFASVLQDARVIATTQALKVLVTTDAGQALHAATARGLGECRWVILERLGFGGPPVEGCGGPAAWLKLTGPEQAPHLLRYGTAEASHGS